MDNNALDSSTDTTTIEAPKCPVNPKRTLVAQAVQARQLLECSWASSERVPFRGPEIRKFSNSRLQEIGGFTDDDARLDAAAAHRSGRYRPMNVRC
jgi:hypothetical protein